MKKGDVGISQPQEQAAKTDMLSVVSVILAYD